MLYGNRNCRILGNRQTNKQKKTKQFQQKQNISYSDMKMRRQNFNSYTNTPSTELHKMKRTIKK